MTTESDSSKFWLVSNLKYAPKYSPREYTFHESINKIENSEELSVKAKMIFAVKYDDIHIRVIYVNDIGEKYVVYTDLGDDIHKVKTVSINEFRNWKLFKLKPYYFSNIG